MLSAFSSTARVCDGMGVHKCIWQGCQTQFPEGRSLAEFCANPSPTETMSFSNKPEGLD